MSEFPGLTPDFYRFFLEIAFQNDKAFFESNRSRYEASIKRPLLQLATILGPQAQQLDERFQTRPAAVVSRIRRDTRYTKDKSLYRDHAWLGWRLPGTYVSESFTLYVEFERDHYGYGMGMYAPHPELMGHIRARILARPSEFLSLVGDNTFAKRFSLEGESFKRARYLDAPDEIRSYLNYKNISFCYRCEQIENTMQPQILDELIEAFMLMKPVYRFLFC